MLTALRKAAGGFVSKIFLVLLAISFGVWGASGAFISGSGSSTVEFGATKVGLVDYRLAYDQQLLALQRQFNQRLNREQADALGVGQNVRAQVIAGAVLDENARELGLGISQDRLAQLIADDPVFRDQTGRFSRLALEGALRNAGMRQEDYVRNREAVAVRRQFFDAVSPNASTSDAFMKAYAVFQGEKRSMVYATIKAENLKAQPVPTDADLNAFYEKEKAAYVAPEYRKFTYVRLTAEDIAKPDEVSAEDIAADYAAKKAGYTTAEKRKIEQLVFPNADAAKAAHDKIVAGGTFEQAVLDAGRTLADTELGTLAKTEVPDTAVADAAFNLALNTVSEPVAGVFGSVLLRVTEIQPETVKPLDEVKADIAKAIALEKASEQLFDLHDKLEDDRAAGDSLEDAAKKSGLEAKPVEAADSRGNDKDGKSLELPESAALMRDVFQTDVGVEAAPVQIGTAGFIWFDVKEVIPERQKPLEEVRATVTADWIKAETAKRVSELAEAVRARVEKGEELAAVIADAELLNFAAESPLKTAEAGPITRTQTGGDLDRNAVLAAFSVPQGGVVTSNAPAEAQVFVIKITSVQTGEPGAVPEEVKTQISGAISDEILDAMVADMQGRGELKINEQAINAVLAQ